ncbi:hypothetical protein [Anaerotignum lactatifermentans]|uniref:hypothetical protein n=1 Tax=Anaerotignum lactatifermentans TaxID=160404 RepID=UPI002ED37D37
MNPITKTYCRIYQNLFRIAIPFLPYRKPALLHHVEAVVPLLHKKTSPGYFWLQTPISVNRALHII